MSDKLELKVPPPLAELASDSASLAALTEALEHLLQAVAVVAISSYRRGWDERQESFKKLYEQKLTPLFEQINKVVTDAETSIDKAEAGLEMMERAASRTAADVVYDTIQRRPGMTGAELVRFLEGAGMPIHERTVRTALFRLKVDKIAAVENRWYTAEAAREIVKGRNERKTEELSF